MASTHTSLRHAILITAYTDFVQLISLVEMFDYRFDIYIHIDKKAKISNTCFHLLEALPNVKVVDRVYAVNRGGRNHIDATWGRGLLRRFPYVAGRGILVGYQA